jgi:prepilin-type N-terminal cleavage/methylation domain-containing protein
MTRALRSLRKRGDEGYTLTELLVSMTIFALLLALVTAATMQMFGSLRRQTGQTDNLENSRKVIGLLDKQVRYANGINTPATGSDGAFYVEFQVGNQDQQQYCYQWRWVSSTSSLEYRTWDPSLNNPGTATNLSAWHPEGNGISKSGSTPVFSITASTSATAPAHQFLTVTFVSTHGKPAKSTTSQVSLTALNTTSASAPSPSVCKEYGQP